MNNQQQITRADVLGDYEFIKSLIIEAIDLATERMVNETSRAQLQELNEIRRTLLSQLRELEINTIIELEGLNN